MMNQIIYEKSATGSNTSNKSWKYPTTGIVQQMVVHASYQITKRKKNEKWSRGGYNEVISALSHAMYFPINKSYTVQNY